jgi:hypothetical protein
VDPTRHLNILELFNLGLNIIQLIDDNETRIKENQSARCRLHWGLQ